MKVTITAIDDSQPVLVRGTSALGHRGKFGCPLVTGEAIFIPARGYETNLRVGNTISVETGHEAVSGFTVVGGNMPESMQALSDGGDYKICGKVTMVAPEGQVCVAVRGFSFTCDRAELGGVNPLLGQQVEFCLHGLALWDENI